MRRGHDLSTAPSLVEADIADEVAGLHAAIGTVARELRRRRRVDVALVKPPGVTVPRPAMPAEAGCPPAIALRLMI